MMAFQDRLAALPDPLWKIDDTDAGGRITAVAAQIRLGVPISVVAELVRDAHLSAVRSDDGQWWFDPRELDMLDDAVEHHRDRPPAVESVEVPLPRSVLDELDRRAAAGGSDRVGVLHDLLQQALRETPHT